MIKRQCWLNIYKTFQSTAIYPDPVLLRAGPDPYLIRAAPDPYLISAAQDPDLISAAQDPDLLNDSFGSGSSKRRLWIRIQILYVRLRIRIFQTMTLDPDSDLIKDGYRPGLLRISQKRGSGSLKKSRSDSGYLRLCVRIRIRSPGID